MVFFSYYALAAGCTIAAQSIASVSPDALSILTQPSQYSEEDIIVRDVAVIGGGSSGTYGAITLKDLGKSVVVIEKEGRMGGHENTYVDPASGVPIDYGVLAYWNKTVSLDFFARFDIPVALYSDGGGGNAYYDFNSGQQGPNVATSINLTNYALQLDIYPALFYSFNLPYPVPEDLLIPFGEFIIKYGLEDEVWSMQPFLGGIANPADVLQTVTLNMLIWLRKAYTEVAEGVDVAPPKPAHNNGELFANAQAELAAEDSVLLNPTVIAADRNCFYGPGVGLAVQTLTGVKLVLANKLLISIPPVPWNMLPFGLDTHELGLFATFNYSGYYAGLLTNTGVIPNVSYWNAGSNTTYNLPTLPGSYYITPTNVAGVSLYWYASPVLMNQNDVEASVTDEVRRLTSAAQRPSFVAFADHSPFKLVVGADDIADGFYEDLLALQGKKNTWYTGAAFASHNSVVLWNYTLSLVPDILTSLE